MFDALKYNMKHNRKSLVRASTAWFLFGAIILVFVFWGMTPQQQSPEGGTAAIVNGHAVSLADFSELSDRMRRDPRFQQYEQLGGDFSNRIIENQAISQLVEMELVRQASEHERVWTTDAEVRDTIVAIPQFQEEGRFKNDIYRNYLRAVNKTPAQFENEIRREKALTRTVEMFRSSLQPLALETERQKALSEMKANVEFLRVPTEALVVAQSVSASDVDAYLKDPANEAKAKQSFETRKSEFSTEESVHARHILIKSDGTPESDKAALAKIEDIAKRAKSEDFGKLAKQFSEDPGSKEKNGDLGFFTRGKMVPEFDKAAFETKVGETTAPFKTQFGYHIIQIQELKPATTSTFEDVRSKVAGELIARDRSRVALEELEKALKDGDTAAITKFAAQHGLKWEESGTFAIDADAVPKLGPGDEAVQAAFKLTAAKPVSDRMIRQGPTAFVLRYKAPVAEKADPAKGQQPEMVAAFAANRRSEDALRQWMETLRKDAKIVMSERFASRGAPGAGNPMANE